MKFIIRLMLLCSLFFNSHFSFAQTCIASLTTPATLFNGITVTSTSTGHVQISSTGYTSCGVTIAGNAVWVGDIGAYTYTLSFNAPVNNIQVNITAAGARINEDFIFTTDAGDPVITTPNACFSVITGNTVLSGQGAPVSGGGSFFISAPHNFTQLTISGSGGRSGSLIDICQNTITCPSDLTFISPTDDMSNTSMPIGIRQRQAENSITATNLISVGDDVFQNGVVYHAGNFVELKPGFEAVLRSQFAAYIEGCSNSFAYRSQKTSVVTNPADEAAGNTTVNIFPNPTINTVDILSRGNILTKVTVHAVDGKILYNKKLEGGNKLHLDVSNYTKGIYIITITSADGQSYSRKLIKN